MLNSMQVKQDPDYDTVASLTDTLHEKEEEVNRENAVTIIKRAINRNFEHEIMAKEDEILKIGKRIYHVKTMLDKLRSYLLASYFGCNAKLLKGELRSKRHNKRNDNERSSTIHEQSNTTKQAIGKGAIIPVNFFDDAEYGMIEGKQRNEPQMLNHITPNSVVANRFYTKKEIVVGNVSKFIPVDKREKNDQATHKWMVYVRGPQNGSDVSSFVKKIWFFLHPSYMPNDIIEVTRPPFTITKRGWGEFPVRIQIVFCDERNKPVDIIHNLKLDKTYTGLQTLGAETNVELELHRHTFNIENMKRSHVGSLIEEGLKISSSDHVFSKHIEMIDEQMETQETCHSSMYDTCKVMKGKRPCEVPTMAPPLNKSKLASSVIVGEFGGHFGFDAALHMILEHKIRCFRLICSNGELDRLHFAAKSLKEYIGWSFAKRRASEWQRAVELRKSLHSHYADEAISTKELVVWCRKHGYTPPEVHSTVADLDNLQFCFFCGKCSLKIFLERDHDTVPSDTWCSSCLSAEKVDDVFSLTSFENFSSYLSGLQYKLDFHPFKSIPLSTEVEPINCSSVGDDFHVSEDREDVYTALSEIIPILTTPELDWIRDAAAQIEVHLPSITVNQKKMPLLQHMLLLVMKMFIKEIVSKSYYCAKKASTSNKPVVVTPVHILHTLKGISHCDFLTNKCLGVYEDDGHLA